MADETKIPGSSGLPLLGETLAFIGGPYRFVSDRLQKHGRVFRSHLLGKPCVVVSGPEAAKLFTDHDQVQREGSQPSNVFALFAGPSVPHLDGDAHRERKALLMQAFTRDAITHYLPAMQAHVEASFARWATAGELRWMAAMQRLSVESVCESILGEREGPRVDELVRHYRAIDKAFTGVPVALPGSAYAKGLSALESILVIFRAMVAEHRAKPSKDGLSRILTHKTPAGSTLDDDAAAREMHHMIIAGRIVWSHMATLAIELSKAPAIRERLEREVRELAPEGALTVEGLRAMPYLDALVREVKRASPVVPSVFGLAKREIVFEGKTIAKGTMLMLGLRASHELGDVYERPEAFDPERFLAPRAEDERHPHGFFPHGPGQFMTSHHCAGTDYATTLTKVFAIVLARGYRYELPPQALEYRWNQLTPEPRDGLRVVLTARA
ncbi:MAG: cytochrome P450 [Myxococcales bacterium]|nr:cytochrome P450 [Myxococcales bacterium]